MRNSTAVSLAVALSVQLIAIAAPAQTWVETHPATIDRSSVVPDREAQADKAAPFQDAAYQEAELRPDTDLDRTRDPSADKGPLDHPANAGGESNRHE